MKKLCGTVLMIGMLSAVPALAGGSGHGSSGGSSGGGYGGSTGGGTTGGTPGGGTTGGGTTGGGTAGGGTTGGGAGGTVQPGPGTQWSQYANSTGFSNIWSGAQGTSNSYGAAKALGMSSATSQGSAGGGLQPGVFAFTGGITSATSSFAKTMSNGNGYAQSQTSGYAGGSANGGAGYGGTR